MDADAPPPVVAVSEIGARDDGAGIGERDARAGRVERDGNDGSRVDVAGGVGDERADDRWRRRAQPSSSRCRCKGRSCRSRRC